jgi:hypothetical protein
LNPRFFGVQALVMCPYPRARRTSGRSHSTAGESHAQYQSGDVMRRQALWAAA